MNNREKFWAPEKQKERETREEISEGLENRNSEKDFQRKEFLIKDIKADNEFKKEDENAWYEAREYFPEKPFSKEDAILLCDDINIDLLWIV